MLMLHMLELFFFLPKLLLFIFLLKLIPFLLLLLLLPAAPSSPPLNKSNP